MVQLFQCFVSNDVWPCSRMHSHTATAALYTTRTHAHHTLPTTPTRTNTHTHSHPKRVATEILFWCPQGHPAPPADVLCSSRTSPPVSQASNSFLDTVAPPVKEDTEVIELVVNKYVNHRSLVLSLEVICVLLVSTRALGTGKTDISGCVSLRLRLQPFGGIACRDGTCAAATSSCCCHACTISVLWCPD